MYRVEFSKRAQKDFVDLERGNQTRVLKKLDAAIKDPARFFMSLKGVEGFRMRVGDLRILADIDASEQVIIVAAIGKRETIYK
ncbi:MAG: type II toxin-antitoxin system RelE family toxin [Methanobacteriota archaeon]